jgi:L-cysteine:1D-myo-inositol 2-amino-2-deoxy-alpha-D-glucopyranoside ligase
MADATPSGDALLYVCGITPYDATHLGHATTYLAFDTLVRAWTDGGFDVRYVQNVTDVDDPLLERAEATGVDWRDLAAEQIALFHGDMQNLRIIPPNDYVAVTDMIGEVGAAVQRLLEEGLAYRVETDIYFDNERAASDAWRLGDVSSLDRTVMLALSAERGGDPERQGKRDALDPLLWRGPRVGEPAWESAVGAGRPGWHIECSVIVQHYLDTPITVQGGGSDLVFPHHEFSAGHASALTGRPLAEHYLHSGMVALDGEKMSKSLGNLELVSRLVDAGTDPRAVRLALLDRHYRTDWEWSRAQLAQAQARLSCWETWAVGATGESTALLETLRASIVADLDTPAALAAVDAHIDAGSAPTLTDLDAIDALLGVRL